MKLKVSSSLPQFKERAERTWGLKPWEGVNDPDNELLFFGLYHERDYAVFDNFKGKKFVFWGGGDIVRLVEDYERKRILKNHPDTEHFCENEIEAINLRNAGIEPKVVPSFLDDINKYQPIFKEGKKKVWMCAHVEREEEYGIPLAIRMAELYQEIEFHIYGVDGESTKNVIYHGHIPEEQLNEEIKDYHCGFRPNHHDGFSEVTAKSILLGQYPISKIEYPHVMTYKTEQDLKNCFDSLLTKTEPNLEARKYWVSVLNKFIWCTK